MPTPLSLVDDVAAESDVRPRVLVVARRPVGGLRTHLLLTWTALRDAGFAFTFVGPADESLDRLRAAFGASADADFVGAAIESRRCRLWPVVRDLLHDGCFALLQSHGVTAAAHAALANLPLSVPHLTVLHEPLHAPRSPSWLGRLKHWALEQALRRSDAIVAVSEDVRSSLSEISPVFRSLAERVSTIPNGIETRGYTFAPELPLADLHRRLGSETRSILIGFPACTPKGGDVLALLEAARRLQRPIHLVGFDAKSAVPPRVSEDVVVTLDSATDVRVLLPQLDLLVLLSGEEASGYAAMAALSAGVPVLAADAPGLRRLLRGTPAAVVTSRDPAALTEGLRSALDDSASARTRNYIPQARARFALGDSIRRWTTILESSARGARRSASRQTA